MNAGRIARKMVSDLERSGIGMTVQIPGQEPLVITEPKEERMGGAAATLPVQLPQQLSFEVGGELPRPSGASIGITGSGTIKSELFIDDDVTIQVVDARGEIVAEFDGTVVNVAFKKHEATEATAPWVERIHKIKLGD